MSTNASSKRNRADEAESDTGMVRDSLLFKVEL